MANFLTDKQQKVLEVIKQYYSSNEVAPTLSELKDILGIKTKRGVVKHLEALERKGYLNRNSRARGIFLAESFGSDTMSIPVFGFANAGKPLVFAEEDIIGSIKVDKQIIKQHAKTKGELFGLIVKGDSMNMRTINKVPLIERNYLIVDKQAQVNDGDVVLAVIDNAATVKTFKKSKNSVILYPESSNPVHSPIYLRNDIEGFINGKVIAVLENPI